MIRAILAVLDGSAPAEQILPHAAQLAGTSGASLVLLATAAAGRRGEMAAYLETQRIALTTRGLAVRTVVASGDPAQAVQVAACDEGVDIIAIGTQQHLGARTPSLPIAEEVLVRTALPLLLVRVTESPWTGNAGPYRRVLVPLDGTPSAETALAFVAREQLPRTAEIVLLRALPPAPAPGVPESLHLSARQMREQASWEAHQAMLAARDYLETTAYNYLRNTIPHFSVLNGYPAKAILDMTRDGGIDLIAMSMHGHTGFSRLTNGGVAGHVLRHTSVPMLCLPEVKIPASGRDAEPDLPALWKTLAFAAPTPVAARAR